MRFASLLLLAGLASTPALADVTMVPYRAHYDLFGDEGVRLGTLDYALYGSACAGYASSVSTHLEGDRQTTLTMQAEPPGGTAFLFDNRVDVGDKTLLARSGEASGADGEIAVTIHDDLTKTTSEGTYSGDALFPLALNRRVLAAAIGGRDRFMTHHVFDGSPSADPGPETVTTTIAPRSADSRRASEPRDLAKLRSFRITSNFFSSTGGEEVSPSHVTVEDQYEDGVTTRLVQQVGSHTFTADIASLELLPNETCPPDESPRP